MQTFEGKHVFIGLDVHKKTYSVTAICENRVVKKATIGASPSGLVHFCHKFFPEAHIHSAYEAGFSGFSLHRTLLGQGIDSRVVHPASIEIAVRDRVKNDKRDSMKIARQLNQGMLQGIPIPTEEQERRRVLTRLRETLVRRKTQAGNQLKSFLYFHGLMGLDEPKVSSAWIDTLSHRDCPEEVAFGISVYVEEWKYYKGRIAEIDARLRDQAEADSLLEMIYRSVPGIGPTSARILANELGDMSQFRREKQLFSYLGLTPTESSSGEHIRRGRISRQGKPTLRKVLVQAAWAAIRQDPSLNEVYERIRVRSGGKKAIVGVARRLAGRIRACLKEGRTYRLRIVTSR